MFFDIALPRHSETARALGADDDEAALKKKLAENREGEAG